KEISATLRQKQAEIEGLRAQEQLAGRAGDLGKAAELQYGKIPELERSVAEDRKELERVQAEGSFLREEVTDEDIAAIVSKWTGVPVSRMLESELRKLLTMEKSLGERVVGQADALSAVARAVRRSRAGLGDQCRHIVCFLLLWPIGAGRKGAA